MTFAAKVAFVEKLLSAKAASGKTFDEISAEIGVTNAFCSQLFFNQAQLRGTTAAKLKAAVPQLRCARQLLARFPGWDLTASCVHTLAGIAAATSSWR